MRYLPPLFRTCLRLFIGTYFCTLVHATSDPLNYRSIASYYVPPTPENVTTLLGLIQSRPDLSNLAAALQQSGGFEQAFDTNPTWSFTFFAPNNDAFANTGRYFDTFQNTPKGKWWTGNTIIHHYVPNSILKTSNFNATYQRFQTATFLFVGSQVVDGKLTLNQVATVVESDIPVTNGVVHIIDKILDPSAQVYESDLPVVKQAFIPGSCSNTALPYC